MACMQKLSSFNTMTSYVVWKHISILRIFQRHGLKLDRDVKFSGFVQKVFIYRMANSKKIIPFCIYAITFKSWEKTHGLLWPLQKWRSAWWITVDNVWSSLDDKNYLPLWLKFWKKNRQVWRQSIVSLNLKPFKTAALCRKVSQISNLILFHVQNKPLFCEYKISTTNSSGKCLSTAKTVSILKYLIPGLIFFSLFCELD